MAQDEEKVGGGWVFIPGLTILGNNLPYSSAPKVLSPAEVVNMLGTTMGGGTAGVTGPVSSITGSIPKFAGTSGAVLADSGITIDTDGTFAANSDARFATQKAIQTLVNERAYEIPGIVLGSADNAAAIIAGLAVVGNAGGGTAMLPLAPAATPITINSGVTWPAKSSVTLRGRGMDATVIDATGSTTGAIKYSTATRISYWNIRDLTVNSATATGTVLDLADMDTGGMENVRCLVGDVGLKLTSTASRGALRNIFKNCIFTNMATYGVQLTGAQGCHETMFIGGQISINATGLFVELITSAADSIRVYGTQFESNTVEGIDFRGCRSLLFPRFEGNAHDITFASSAFYNQLITAFFTESKFTDSGTAAGIGTNEVIVLGYATSATERIEPVYVPCNPMALGTLVGSIVPGTINRLIIHQIPRVKRSRKVTAVSLDISTQAGNLDVGIFNAGLTPLSCAGSTTCGVANATQNINLTSTVMLLPNRDYYVGVQVDNVTAGVAGVTATSAAFRLMNTEIGARLKDLGAFPIGTQTVSGGSSTLLVPCFRLG